MHFIYIKLFYKGKREIQSLSPLKITLKMAVLFLLKMNYTLYFQKNFLVFLFKSLNDFQVKLPSQLSMRTSVAYNESSNPSIKIFSSTINLRI